jgi:GlpG protein
MRQLTTLTDPSAAHTLADYLLTLKIETRVDQESAGWVVWVCDEDQVTRAREELAEFTRNPSDPRFTKTARSAEAIRKQQDREEKAYQRKQIDMRERWADRGGRLLTVALMVVCAGVAFASKRGEDEQGWLLQHLFIASYERSGNTIEWNYLAQIRQGEVWRLITPIFIHFGLLHLFMNMSALAYYGTMIERRRGVWRLAALILVCAVVSNLAQYYYDGFAIHEGHLIFHQNPRFGGMSGVLFGLFGYVWMKVIYQPELGLELRTETFAMMIAWFFLCFTGWVGPIANTAHAAGLLTGMAVGVVTYFGSRLWRGRR